ncbi:hypothetical protein [Mycolicibacterium helvum]|uniref:DUF998 domain-containing protein n=1 Tax=Mycolicibacterium helvum TaxID=1534349 RepID=A0A7I7T160_9MYCO|nr:hypothetical protein [Mycolicibacterium helvum]BBY62660.1 hypothetical protein MHEL_09030 [Mycolicibacterium helvum]
MTTTTTAQPVARSVGIFGIAAGVALPAFIGIGFILAGFIPPPGPYAADVTAEYFHHDIDLKRLGVILVIVGGSMFMPFGAAIANRLRHVAGIGPLAAMTQFGAAVIATTLMMICGTMMLVGLHRPDMADSSYQLLNHVTWMALIGLWQPGAMQAAATAWAILGDSSSTPVFPRWVGWYSLCMAFGSLTGSLIPFFTYGPFTWNGFISFWIAGAIFFAWYNIMVLQLYFAHRRNRADRAKAAVR